MSIATLVQPAPVIPERIGVLPPNDRARGLERRIALAVVIIPFLGLVAAIALLWGLGIGWLELGLLAGMYTVGIVGIGVGFHRHFSHGSFQTTPVIRWTLAVMGSMAGQGPVLYWAAIHRRHHSCSDQPGDPHSPHLHNAGVGGWLRGFWHSHTGWLFHHEITDWGRYIIDLLRDPVLFRINRLYFVWVFLGLLIPAAIGGAVTGTWMGAFLGFLWGGLVRICLGHHTTWSVNSLCHLFGSRPYRSNDESRNNFLIALPAFGEGWHNNHHAFPYSAYHGLEWYQIDWNGLCIRVLKLLGLAWNVKVPSARALEEARKKPALAAADPKA
jgi:stearoyl-CoA desaturase (Delta-9 desaturase)